MYPKKGSRRKNDWNQFCVVFATEPSQISLICQSPKDGPDSVGLVEQVKQRNEGPFTIPHIIAFVTGLLHIHV